MRTVSHAFVDKVTFRRFFEEHQFDNAQTYLVQLFTSATDRTTIETLLRIITDHLPYAGIIGTTCSDAIFHGRNAKPSHIVSITSFDQTRIRTQAVPSHDTDRATAETLVSSLWSDHAALLMAFHNGDRQDDDGFVNGLHTVSEATPVVGGTVVTDGRRPRFVFNERVILSNGAVGAVLENKDLHVGIELASGWQPVGKPMRITQTDGRRVYTIDHRPALDIYTHYLGKETADRLDDNALVFPLLTYSDGVQNIHQVTAVHGDGSLSFSLPFKANQTVTFGYGNPELLISQTLRHHQKIADNPIESIFIFASIGRKRFLPRLIERESVPLQRLAETNGLFIQSVFFTRKHVHRLDLATVFVSLSETETTQSLRPIRTALQRTSDRAAHALSHLLQVTTTELQERNRILQRYADELQAQKEALEFVQKVGKFGSWVFDLRKHTVEWSEQLYQIYGLPDDFQPDEHTFLSLVLSEDRQTVYDAILHAYEHRHIDFQVKARRQDGKIIDIWVNGRMVFDSDGTPLKLIGTTIDISEMVRLKERLERKTRQLDHLAHHDTLTKLPNRAFFDAYLRDTIEQASCANVSFAVLFIDLDNFKQINDTLGHHYGDKLLRSAAKRLRRTIRQSDFLARIGGDEFTVILSHVTDKNGVRQATAHLADTIRQPFVIDTHTFSVSASIGIALYPHDAVAYDDLLKYADTAMYQAKYEGKNKVCFYDEIPNEG